MTNAECKTVEAFTVGQLARLSGVSVRTLHHYDAIGLLRPQRVRTNGYRTYTGDDLLKLQEILFYREVEMPLGTIAEVLGTGDRVARLTRHRAVLLAKAERAKRLLDTLDATLKHIKGQREMTFADLYVPFPPERQNAYEQEMMDRNGPAMAQHIDTSKRAIADLGGAEVAAERMKGVEASLVALFEAASAPAEALTRTLEEHRALVTAFWGRPCDGQAYEGLADLYADHPDFRARYERLSPGFSVWLPQAMRAHAKRLAT